MACALIGNSIVKPYTSKKLFIYQILGVNTGAWLLTSFLWHLMFFIAYGLIEYARMVIVVHFHRDDSQQTFISFKLLAIVVGSFTMIPLTYLLGFALRHRVNLAPAYLILIVYIFGYLAAEIHTKFNVYKSRPFLLFTTMLANPFIFLIWLPKMINTYKEDYVRISLALCVYTVLIGIALMFLLKWLIDHDLLKIKAPMDSKCKLTIHDEENDKDAALRASQISKVYQPN